MDWRTDDRSFSGRVSPFRHLRIDGYLLLPAAFRSLSRLSSALSAKASTLRSFLLDLCSMYSVTSFSLSQLLSKLYCLLELIKTFVSTFGLFIFSDVLIFFKEFSIISLYEVFKVHLRLICLPIIRNLNLLKPLITGNTSYYLKQHFPAGRVSLTARFMSRACRSLVRAFPAHYLLFLFWQPPAFPCRLQHSIIGRLSLNHRVRDVDGCFPKAHRHQK